MLLPRKSVPRSSGQLDHTKTTDHCKETQTVVVRSCLPFIRSGQNHFVRHSERGKKTRQTEEEVGRQHQGMDRPEFGRSQRAMEKREKWRKLVEIICGAPTTLAVKR